MALKIFLYLEIHANVCSQDIVFISGSASLMVWGWYCWQRGSTWFLMCSSSIIFLTSSQMCWRSPGRGRGCRATFRLLMWHMLSYETMTSFQSSLFFFPNAATSHASTSKNTCAGPSDLSIKGNIHPYAISNSGGNFRSAEWYSHYYLLIKWLPRLNVSSSTNAKPGTPGPLLQSPPTTCVLIAHCLRFCLLISFVKRCGHSTVLWQYLWSTCIWYMRRKSV